MIYSDKVRTAIEKGLIVCPFTKQKLLIANDLLETTSKDNAYRFLNGVPVLIDQKKQGTYLSENEGKMFVEYTEEQKNGFKKWLSGKLNSTIKDYPTEESVKAFNSLFENVSDEKIMISVGGGPRRVHKNVINLNIDSFNNVDIVADAYSLPFADESIDGIYCGAVLEHLEFPEKAVSEMFRVLKKDAKVYCDTPFLQPYHGYPNHFQNFTLTGHVKIFERANFVILNSGVCVGPTYMIGELMLKYIKTLRPVFVSKFLSVLFILMIAPFRRLDKKIKSNDSSYELASTTFVFAKKP